jgi:membrane associated rhomboid family serine protease
MLLPYSIDVGMERVPITNWVLMGFTCIFTIVMWVFEAKRTATDIDIEIDPSVINVDPSVLSDPRKRDKLLEEIERSLEPPAPLLSLQRKHFRIYQLVSHIFVHADLWHLGGNMLALFLFGNAINAKLGHFRFLWMYFAFGILAGLCWLALGQGESALGASGAIMGICGLFFVFYPTNEVSVLWFFLYRGGTFDIESYWLILLWFAGDLWGCFFSSAGGIAYVAHLAGALAGVAVGIFLVVNDFVEAPTGEENLLQSLGLRESSDRWDSKGLHRVPRKVRKRKKPKPPARDME